MSLPPQPAILSRPFFEDKNRAFWTLQAAGWTGYLILRSVSSISNASDMTSMVPVVIESIVGYSITLLLSTLYHYYRRQPRFAMAILTVLTLAAATLVYAVLDAFSFSFINARNPGLNLGLVLGTIFLNFTVLAGWTALYFGINFYLIVEDQIDQLAALENTASSAQLAMLRYQLNPHFLFNTLNSISTLVLLKETERANAMLGRLSSFLRYTLANEPTANVTVVQEFETLKLYLEIEKMRFEDRLRPTFELDPRVAKARLPSLLLQPLVENAIKYAVTPQEDGAEIAVTARLAGDRVQIVVSDTGPGLNESRGRPSVSASQTLSTGVGLANIRERLAQAYGPDHRFETRSIPGGGFGVEIEIPFQLEEPKKEAA
ncbi:MAG: sensor histidine kinase [Sphingomonas sp.]|jgi:signal transduction histidine kinase|nr:MULTISPECIES: histidine kinase [unclassified Sphingomonas]MDR6847220.1 signal transduction histidine kinase [Sphingomonas sp. BE137]MDR7256764.1 signal transduction histidine kinase [Sphingomonas sp. BE270]